MTDTKAEEGETAAHSPAKLIDTAVLSALWHLAPLGSLGATIQPEGTAISVSTPKDAEQIQAAAPASQQKSDPPCTTRLSDGDLPDSPQRKPSPDKAVNLLTKIGRRLSVTLSPKPNIASHLQHQASQPETPHAKETLENAELDKPAPAAEASTKPKAEDDATESTDDAAQGKPEQASSPAELKATDYGHQPLPIPAAALTPAPPGKEELKANASAAHEKRLSVQPIFLGRRGPSNLASDVRRRFSQSFSTGIAKQRESVPASNTAAESEVATKAAGKADATTSTTPTAAVKVEKENATSAAGDLFDASHRLSEKAESFFEGVKRRLVSSPATVHNDPVGKEAALRSTASLRLKKYKPEGSQENNDPTFPASKAGHTPPLTPVNKTEATKPSVGVDKAKVEPAASSVKRKNTLFKGVKIAFEEQLINDKDGNDADKAKQHGLARDKDVSTGPAASAAADAITPVSGAPAAVQKEAKASRDSLSQGKDGNAGSRFVAKVQLVASKVRSGISDVAAAPVTFTARKHNAQTASRASISEKPSNTVAKDAEPVQADAPALSTTNKEDSALTKHAEASHGTTADKAAEEPPKVEIVVGQADDDTAPTATADAALAPEGKIDADQPRSDPATGAAVQVDVNTATVVDASSGGDVAQSAAVVASTDGAPW